MIYLRSVVCVDCLEFVGSCLLFFVLTIIYELIKALRAHIGTMHHCSCTAPDGCHHESSNGSSHAACTTYQSDGRTTTGLTKSAQPCQCTKKYAISFEITN